MIIMILTRIETFNLFGELYSSPLIEFKPVSKAFFHLPLLNTSKEMQGWPYGVLPKKVLLDT